VVNIAGMSEPIFFRGGQHCRNVIKKSSFHGWSTSPEQVVTMDQNRWSRWIGIYTGWRNKHQLLFAVHQ